MQHIIDFGESITKALVAYQFQTPVPDEILTPQTTRINVQQIVFVWSQSQK